MSVAGGAALSATGTLGGSVTNAGTLAPGLASTVGPLPMLQAFSVAIDTSTPGASTVNLVGRQMGNAVPQVQKSQALLKRVLRPGHQRVADEHHPLRHD